MLQMSRYLKRVFNLAHRLWWDGYQPIKGFPKQWVASTRPCHGVCLAAVIASRHDTCVVICLAVKGEYPQTNVAVNTAFGLGASAPSGAGETFTK